MEGKSIKCIVTGGAGFIGSHLVDQLLSDGNEVVAVDNLITGSKKNIAHLNSNSHFTFLEHDVSQPLPQDITAKMILHFASPASPPKYQKYPVETLLVNTVGTYHLLERARRDGAVFIFASTSEVYGDQLEHPQKETYWGRVNPNGERSCYDEGKRAGEAYTFTYLRKYDLDCRIVRIFNTYGPRMDIDDGRVVTNFIKQVINEKALTIYGDGNQTRSFCYISDLVEGIIRLINNPAAKGGVINLGNPQEMTVLELAEAVKQITGYSGHLIHEKLPTDDPIQRKPDISRAGELLHWTTTVSLEEGLRQTFAYFKNLDRQ